MLKFVAFVFVILLGANSVNTQNVAIGELPFMASIQFNHQHVCGGAILDRRWILTAAHCVVGNPVELYTVLVGTTDLDYGGTRINAAQIVPHELYSEPFLNDVALIKLTKDLCFGRYVKPVLLTERPVFAENYVVLSGWGYSSTNGLLKRKVLPTISNERCKTSLVTELNENHLCTLARRGSGICQGDSGGPIIDAFTKEQVGVAIGNVPDSEGYPDVYARISSCFEWIEARSKER